MHRKGSTGCFELICINVLFGSKIVLLVWTIMLAISIANSACVLLDSRSMNETSTFLHN